MGWITLALRNHCVVVTQRRTFKAVRIGFLLAITVLGACAETHPEGPGETCRRAMSMRERALSEALAEQPPCAQDADCALLTASVQCGDVVNLGDCGRPAHRAALERYAAARVTERICATVQGAEYGCGVQPLCIAGSSAVCSAGECVLAAQ